MDSQYLGSRAAALNKPPIMFKSVDFPQPEGPIKATNTTLDFKSKSILFCIITVYRYIKIKNIFHKWISAHKFCGPSGMGALYGKFDELKNLIPTYVGGSTVVNSTYKEYKLLPPPSCFEAGLQNYAGAIGSGAAAEYVMNIGRDNIHEHENKLNKLMTKELSDVESLNLVGPSRRDGEQRNSF